MKRKSFVWDRFIEGIEKENKNEEKEEKIKFVRKLNFMEKISPGKFDSIQDYLLALHFQIKDDFFINGIIVIHVKELKGHTTFSFYEKMKERGWFPLW